MSNWNEESQATISKIGKTLREKREELNYSVDQVAAITRISKRVLEDIEEGEIARLPAMVFTRGFIRNYAEVLETDYSWMLEDLELSINQPPQKSSIQQNSSEEDTSDTRAFPFKLGLSFLALLVVISIGGSFYYFPQFFTETPQEEEIVQSIQSGEEVNGTPVENSVSGNSSPQEGGTLTVATDSGTKETPKVISPLNLVVKGKTSGWLHLKIDNERSFDLKVEENGIYEWPAQKNFSITMSTGSLAYLFLNKEEIIIDSSESDKLYQNHLNKFSLIKMNN